MLRREIILILTSLIIMVFISSCTMSAVKDVSNTPEMKEEKGFFQLPLSETDLVRAALASLNNQAGIPDYDMAKAKLNMLLEQYPKGKWVTSAQNLLQTIDNIKDLHSKVKFEMQAQERINADKSRILKENETLRKDQKHLAERYQMEIVKLQQENEQLKKDISLLKKLEIQLEKREKMLK